MSCNAMSLKYVAHASSFAFGHLLGGTKKCVVTHVVGTSIGCRAESLTLTYCYICAFIFAGLTLVVFTFYWVHKPVHDLLCNDSGYYLPANC